MKRVFFIFVLFSAPAFGQLWNGVLSSSRAIDWSKVGLAVDGYAPGTLPSASWSQCGSTIAAYSGTAATISNALQHTGTGYTGCGANTYVLLGAGTFTLSTGISFGTTSNTALRGSGANSTFLVFTGDISCQGPGADFCLAPTSNDVGSEQNVCDWTAGYSAGATSITLANCGSTTPAAGSLSNLAVNSLLILDQLDEASDPGTIWNCSTQNICANTTEGGWARTDGTCNGTMCNRSQQQVVTVTNISGSTITISPGLYMPNWRTGQKPQAWFSTSIIKDDGIENLSMNHQNSGSTYGALFLNCSSCWVSGVASLYANRDHFGFIISAHGTVQNSYLYQNVNHASVSYGIEMNVVSDSLVQNNICQQITDSCPNNNGGEEGNVAAYNFAIDDQWYENQWMQPPFYQHTSGDAYNLWEGNIGTGYEADSVHGTHHFNTLFRNYLIGTQNSSTTTCPFTNMYAYNETDSCYQTVPIALAAASRYFNIIGNVLGQTNFHNGYTCLGAATNCPQNNIDSDTASIYAFGYTAEQVGQPNSTLAYFCLTPACASTVDYDPQSSNYAMRWGNYDAYHAVTQWNSGEVPSGIASYSNPVPSSETLPNSFYLTATTAASCGTGIPWWKNPTSGTCPAFPPIGSDVSSGNIGICSTSSIGPPLPAYLYSYTTTSSQCTAQSLTYSTAVAGHANGIPAMACYLQLGGSLDGSGSALTFNPASCYANDPSGTPPPAPSPSGILMGRKEHYEETLPAILASFARGLGRALTFTEYR